MEWWDQLTTLNQILYGCAMFFSLIFLWQLVLMIIGFGGGEADADGDVDVDVDADADFDAGADGDVAIADAGDVSTVHMDTGVDADGTYDDFADGAAEDATATLVSFKMLSFRSVLAFFTLFSWGSAFYMNDGVPAGSAMALGALWGAVGMVLVAGIFYLMKRLTETGTSSLRTCVGRLGRVYVAIPADGYGEIRVIVSGRISFVKARGVGGQAIAPGTPVRVAAMVDPTTLEVQPQPAAGDHGKDSKE